MIVRILYIVSFDGAIILDDIEYSNESPLFHKIRKDKLIMDVAIKFTFENSTWYKIKSYDAQTTLSNESWQFLKENQFIVGPTSESVQTFTAKWEIEGKVWTDWTYRYHLSDISFQKPAIQVDNPATWEAKAGEQYFVPEEWGEPMLEDHYQLQKYNERFNKGIDAMYPDEFMLIKDSNSNNLHLEY